jgi:hypothetical protein
MRRIVGFAFVVGGALAGCHADAPAQLVQAIDHQSIGGSTTVSPQPLRPPRVASCPGNTLPDLCGTWEGVELSATKSYSPTKSHDDAHCFCRAIAFQIPAEISVTQGDTGVHRATFSYRDTDQDKIVSCTYKGDAHAGHSTGATGGGSYAFESCSNGAQAGATAHGDWFSLSLNMGDLVSGTTVATLRLGAPDTDPSGAPFIQDIYSTDPSIPNAALHVPRGAAPAGQQFTINVASPLSPPTIIPNDGDPATSVGPIVDYSAVGVTGTFYFNPTTPCARIDLPYSAAVVDSVAGGPGREVGMRVRQVIDLPDLLVPDLTTLVSVNQDRIVDPTNQIVSFCTAHLTQLLAAWNEYNATFQSAHYGSAAQNPNLMAPNTQYTLTLQFNNTDTAGTSWLTNEVAAVNYDPTTNAATNDGAGHMTWAASVPLIGPVGGAAGTPVGATQTGLFQGTITSPSQPGNYVISFCTQVTIPLDAGVNVGPHLFGDCYKTTITVAAETCGNDQDGDGIIGNGVPPRACSTGLGGVCDAGQQSCVVGSSPAQWTACTPNWTPGAPSVGGDVIVPCSSAGLPGLTLELDVVRGGVIVRSYVLGWGSDHASVIEGDVLNVFAGGIDNVTGLQSLTLGGGASCSGAGGTSAGEGFFDIAPTNPPTSTPPGTELPKNLGLSSGFIANRLSDFTCLSLRSGGSSSGGVSATVTEAFGQTQSASISWSVDGY